jgi:hypothetical protein
MFSHIVTANLRVSAIPVIFIRVFYSNNTIIVPKYMITRLTIVMVVKSRNMVVGPLARMVGKCAQCFGVETCSKETTWKT